jgi:hypothetical protein
MSRAKRAVVAAVAVLGAIALAPVAAQAKAPNPLATPTSNTQPSTAFSEACFIHMTTSKASNDRCDAAALKDFDKVRAKEGLGPMTLPHDFDTLSVTSQLLAIANIERVDRGLIPFKGRSKALDAIAQTGANHDEDPRLPQPLHGNIESGEWAGGAPSALYDDFDWMYDDGFGSGNEDCTSPTAPGCWGHRFGIIDPQYTAPLVMGAATAQHDTSMAMLFISGDTKDKVNVAPSWAKIAATMPVGLSAGTVRITARSAGGVHASVKVRSYTHVTITAKVTSGAGSWSVSPRSCHLAAGHTCRLQVSFHSSTTGIHDGAVRVRGPGGVRVIKLVGRRN